MSFRQYSIFIKQDEKYQLSEVQLNEDSNALRVIVIFTFQQSGEQPT